MKDDVNPLYADVWPSGILDVMLRRILNPRRTRWNAYLRACRAIPKDSPVAGSTSFKRINERRLELIGRMFVKRGDGTVVESPEWKSVEASAEYRAIKRVANEWMCGPTVATNFLIARKLRRLRAEHDE